MRTYSTRWLFGVLMVSLATGCGGDPPGPPGPGEALGYVPDLRGATVLVFPVQIQTAVPQGVMADAELAHALRSNGEGVSWTYPEDIEELLARSPGVRIEMRNLPVLMFLQAEVRRIGDPLYGNIRRAAALAGAEVALIPVELSYGYQASYTLAATLINVSTGRVLWYGVVPGQPGEPDSPGTMASVAEAVALVLMRMR